MIKWDESLATGDETIDSQHKMLFEFLNDLNRDIVGGKPTVDFNDHLQFLKNYAKSHFCYEESCMEKYQCPAAEKNKNAHEEFLEFIKKFEEGLQGEAPSARSLAGLHHFIEHWIVAHIMKIDTQLKPCLSGDPDPEKT